MIYQKTEYELRTRKTPVCDGLKEFREQNGLSQAEMAKLMSVSKRSYIDYEHGARAASSDAISELSAWSDIDLNELFRGEKEAIAKVKIEGLIEKLFQILSDFGALREGLKTEILEKCLIEYLTTRSTEVDIDRQALKGIMVEELLKNGDHENGPAVGESLELLRTQLSGGTAT